MSGSLDTELSSILDAGVRQGAAAGAVAIVVDRDGVMWEHASGERVLGCGTNMTTDTVGAIFSMTKAITGAAAMQLVEQGKLDLDAPAGDICSWLHQVQVLTGFDPDGQALMRPPKTPITLRHLLTHTSGFVYELWNPNEAKWRASTGAPSLFSREHAALRTPLAFDPGTQWEYGIGIDWAGKMVEQVSGMKLGQYLQANVTAPLGMTDTAFTLSASMLERAAGMHRRQADGSLTSFELPTPAAPEFEMGGGGLHGTMRDYGRFIRMILNDGELDSVRVLKAETVAMMSQNQIGDLRVKKLTTTAPSQSHDAEFFPSEPKSWGLTFQINETAVDTGRPAGTLMWAGLANSFFWIDRSNGIAGAYLSQILPFADASSLGLFLDLERAVYASLAA